MDMEEEPFFANIDDLRVRGIRPLMPPACVIEELPTDSSLKRFIFNTRCAISATIQGDDERLLVVAGPSSVHEPKAVLEYAARLRALAAGALRPPHRPSVCPSAQTRERVRTHGPNLKHVAQPCAVVRPSAQPMRRIYS